MNLQQYHEKALKEGWAIGHFNVSNLEQIRAIVEAAAALKCPVMIGTSEGERKYIGPKQAAAVVKSLRQETGLPIFLNADHSKSVDSAKAAVDAGYDSIHIDLSALPYEENLKGTKEVVEYAKSKVYSDIGEIHVEGELGLLLGESKIQKEVIEVNLEQLTKPEEAHDFVEKTGVDRMAPAVGNIHGIPANVKTIDIELIRTIRHHMASKTGLTLHGASGISDDQIVGAIKAGINNIHINTEIRVAYVNALRKALEENPEETTPFKLFPSVIAAVRHKVEEKLRLFGSVNKI